MGEIHKLPEEVVEAIAAGEVVERPASVVKELVENSIDAGAREIEITIRKGGKKLIVVKDDGIGIAREDVPLAFERYATSKIYSPEDLYSITTMGFRGEALAAIASVARVEMITRRAGEEEGTYAYVESSKVVDIKPTGAPVGTTVKVMDLFYNLPPRLKFISNEKRETNAIVDVVIKEALSHPEIRFRLVGDGTLLLSTPGDGKLEHTILSLFGRDVASHIITLDLSGENIKKIWGAIGDTTIKRATKRFIYTFVNRRPVVSVEMTDAIRDAYGNLIPKGYYPFAVLFIDIEPSQVDVNVHPSKIEVRFRHPEVVKGDVRRAIVDSLKQSVLVVERKKVKAKPIEKLPLELDEMKPPEAMTTTAAASASGDSGKTMVSESLKNYGVSSRSEVHAIGRFHGMKALGEDEAPLPEMRILGQIGSSYIVCDSPEGMILIDQHALHERIMYHTLRKESERLRKDVQRMLTPLRIEMPEHMRRAILDERDKLRELGIEVEEWDGGVEVHSFPVVMDWHPTMDEIKEILLTTVEGELPEDLDIEERILRLMACKSAIKANTPLSMDQMESLLQQARAVKTPYACAHGRPTMILIPLDAIGRMFERS